MLLLCTGAKHRQQQVGARAKNSLGLCDDDGDEAMVVMMMMRPIGDDNDDDNDEAENDFHDFQQLFMSFELHSTLNSWMLRFSWMFHVAFFPDVMLFPET